MKNVKRVVSLLLVIVMSLGLFVGCKKEEKTANEGERVLTVGIPQSSSVPDYNTNAFCEYLEEKTGIEITWVYFAAATSSYKQQLTLKASANDELPDVLLGFGGLGHYLINQFGEDGYVIDLTDLIENNAPNFKAQLEYMGKEFTDFIMEKGKNTNTGEFYAMPRGSEKLIDSLQSQTWINKNWLDKVGKAVPTTTDELYDVLKAWKAYGDLNENGEDDEIYMLLDTEVQNYILNGFVELSGNNWNVKDGKLWDPMTSDELRQGLIYANKLTQEGLIDKLSFSVTGNTERKQVITPTEGGSKVGIWGDNYVGSTNHAMEQLQEFVALPALKDATGKGGYTIFEEYGVSWTTMITKDCENPELAMEFIDCFYEDETVSRMRHGEKGVDWEYQEGTTLQGTPGYVKVINSDVFSDGSLNKTVTANWLGMLTNKNYLAIKTGESGKNTYEIETDRLYAETLEYWNAGKFQEEPIGDLIYTQQEYEIREEKQGTLATFMTNAMTLFVSGEQDPGNDTDWNAYLSDLKKYGREDLQKIAQDAYSRMHK